MKIVFRADAGRAMGTGHVRRCLTLARALASSVEEIAFLARPADGDLNDLVSAEGHRWLPISGATDAASDAAACRSLLERSAPWDWLVVDHYGLDARWESALRPAVRRILAIDDLADRAHDCDVLLDQNDKGDADPYRGKVPPGARCLLGPSHALLRGEFAEERARSAPRRGELRRLIVSFGGSDPTNETEKFLSALSSRPAGIETIDVVFGRADERTAALVRRASAHAGVRCHVAADDMARRFASADLAVGAAGTTTWERACLHLPAVVTAVAPNQVEIAAAAARRGAAVNLGYHDRVRPEDYADALRTLAEAPARLAEMSRRAGALTDGRGAERVAAVMKGFR